MADSVRCTVKKEKKIVLILRKFSRDRVQSQKWLRASSYKSTYLCISSYIRKPFLIYDFAPDVFWISFYMRKISFSFLSVCTYTDLFKNLVFPFFHERTSWIKFHPREWLKDYRVIRVNRVISSLEGKFGRVGEHFVLVLERLFMKISNLCKNICEWYNFKNLCC